MRTHGWAGSPPDDDEAARDRVLNAAREVISRTRRAPRMAEVARDLGVSRATVYRYFRDADELLVELASRETRPFLDGLTANLKSETDPARAVMSAVMFVVDRLPENPYLALAFATDSRGTSAAGITSPSAQAFGREVLHALDVDWAGAGFDEPVLTLLVEQMLRLVQSFVVDPGKPARHGADLEAYLEMWFAPAVRALMVSQASL